MYSSGAAIGVSKILSVCLHESHRHIGAHSAKTDHAKLHLRSPRSEPDHLASSFRPPCGAWCVWRRRAPKSRVSLAPCPLEFASDLGVHPNRDLPGPRHSSGDNLILQRRVREARAMFEPAGVAERRGVACREYDPRTRCQMGNFLQAFSHVALVNTAYNFTRSDATTPQGGLPCR
jgi:hypothetical protein